ncbi:MAG: hypothetical protein SynsKO_22830 [Synoicihabitans sp.]
MIIPDANLILYAYDSESPFHQDAARWWSKLLSSKEPVGLCSVVIFAFMRLATHNRVYANPMTPTDARRHIKKWLGRPNVRLLVQGSDHIESTCRLLEKAGTAGNLVTDAQIAALAVEFEATVHTADTDFGRFPDISWANPLLSPRR